MKDSEMKGCGKVQKKYITEFGKYETTKLYDRSRPYKKSSLVFFTRVKQTTTILYMTVLGHIKPKSTLF